MAMSLITDTAQASALFDRFGPVISLGDADVGGVPRSMLRRLVDHHVVIRVAKSALTQRSDFERCTD